MRWMHSVGLMAMVALMTETTTVEASTPAPAAKSIVNPKYRDKYKGAAKDWLSQYLTDNCSKTKSVTKTIPNPENPDEKITKTETRADGVDVDKLLELGRKNGEAKVVERLEPAIGSHGFAGRARMTLRNSLQRVVKERHGLIGLDGTFVAASPEFLKQIGAGDSRTHNDDGSKIAVSAAATATLAPEEAPEDAGTAPATDVDDAPKGGKKSGGKKG